MSIEGIPDGWMPVRFDYAVDGEAYVKGDGEVTVHVGARPTQAKRLIVRKIEKPKHYRPFENAAEFEPHRDRWIKRSSKHDTSETLPAGCFKVSGYNDHHYWTDGGRCTSYEAAFYDGKCFEDGTPFGVEVT